MLVRKRSHLAQQSKSILPSPFGVADGGVPSPGKRGNRRSGNRAKNHLYHYPTLGGQLIEPVAAGPKSKFEGTPQSQSSSRLCFSTTSLFRPDRSINRPKAKATSAQRPSAQNGDPTRAAGSTKGGGKPSDVQAASNGQTLSDTPALKPYWGKPAVRNFREGNGNVGIIRSPLRAIALPDQSSGENRGQPYTPVNHELAFIHVILCSSRSIAQSWNHSRWRVGSYTDGCTAGDVDFDRFETYDARQAERRVRLVSYCG
jgi:hypothetical protein